MASSKIRSRVLALIYFCFIIILLPLFCLFILTPIICIRIFVFICAKCFHRKKYGRMLGGISGIHTVDKITKAPTGNLIVSLYMDAGFQIEVLRPKFITNVIEKRTPSGQLQYPELREYISSFMGFSFWTKDKDFDPNRQIIYYDSDENIDEEKLRIIREELIKKPWNEKRPLWEFIAIENFYRKEKESESRKYTPVILFRAHHCLLDGFSILNILVEDLTNLSLEKVIAKVSPPISSSSNTTKAIKEISILEKFWNNLTFPIRSLYEFSLELTKEPDVNPWHDPNVKLCRNGTFTFSNLIPVDYIKEVKNKQGVSFTTVILAGICSGIRRGMEENNLKIPQFIDCFAAFPVKSHPKKLTNHMTHCVIRLPTGNPDRKNRLIKIEKNLQKIKKSTLPILNFYITRIFGLFPRTVLEKVVTKPFPATVAVSNFPGPNEMWSLAGVDVYKIQFDAGPILGLGIGYFCLTYNGSAQVFAGVDNALGNSDQISKSLIKYFVEEIDILNDSSQ